MFPGARLGMHVSRFLQHPSPRASTPTACHRHIPCPTRSAPPIGLCVAHSSAVACAVVAGIKGLIRIRCGRLVIAWNAPAGLHTPHRTRSYVPCEHAARAWCKRSHAEGPLWCVPSPTGKSHHAGRLLAAEHSSGALVPFCDSSCRQHCTGRGSYR